MIKKLVLAAAAASALTLTAAAVAWSQDDHGHDMGNMGMEAAPSADLGPAAAALQAANDAMHRDMAITYTGKPDVDFVLGMIPHHQGAVEMARIELQYGTDPEIRALAEGIIKAQEDEIAMMRAWLAKNQ